MGDNINTLRGEYLVVTQDGGGGDGGRNSNNNNAAAAEDSFADHGESQALPPTTAANATMQAANAPGLMASMTNADNRLVGFAGAQALQNSQGDAVVAQNSNNEGVAPAPMGGGGHGTAQGV